MWRLPSQEFDLERLQPTVEHGGLSVMVWGTIWCEGRSALVECEGSINSSKQVSILKEGLVPIFSSGQINKDDTLFMEDAAPCHTARGTQLWLSENGISKLPWPSQSPDMNPIEPPLLDRSLCKKKKKPSDRLELLGLLRETWQEISQDEIRKLISSMPRRVLTLQNAKGMSTKN